MFIIILIGIVKSVGVLVWLLHLHTFGIGIGWRWLCLVWVVVLSGVL